MAENYYCKGILYPNGSVEILRRIECPEYGATPERRLHEKALEYITMDGLEMATTLARLKSCRNNSMQSIEFELETAARATIWKTDGSIRVRLKVK